MHRKRLYHVIPIVVLFLLFTALNVNAQYIVGDTAADFTLPDAYGTNISLYDYEGQVVLLNFWQTF